MMYIEAIKIDILTESHRKYGRFVSFLKEDGTKREINLIYGENNLGKSTLIKSIIYALGGEDLYGKSSWNDTNFPPIMKQINGEEVIQNTIFLQLINHENKRVTIARNALERNSPITIYHNIGIENIDTAEEIEYLKIKKDAYIDGNKTFQEFLFQYFNLPEVQYDGTKVYFQNLMPLFIIPQTSWNDIQAVNPYYGVPELKQKVFEILMNFSTVKNLGEEIKLKIKREELKGKRRSLQDIEDILSVFKLKSLAANEQETKELNNKLEQYQLQLTNIEESKIEVNDNVKPLREKFRRLNNITRRQEEQLHILEKEIEEYSYYINKINLDIDKIDKLSTAKKMISILPIQKCPHCLSNITIDEEHELENNNCSLCGHDFMINNHPKSQQLFGYLLDEKKDFENIKKLKVREREEIESKLFLLKLDVKEIQETLDELDTRLKPDYLKEYHFLSREIGRLNNEISNLTREKAIISKYELVLQEIDDLDEEVKGLVKSVNKKEEQKDDDDKLKFFTKAFKELLKKLEFIKDGFDGEKLKEATNKIFKQITIDKNDYRPKIDGKNLFYITSSSGLIRIIISYYLAFLETALEKDTNHPKILIFDEPRQQNLDKDTFNAFTTILKSLAKEHKGEIQIIFTSGNTGLLEENHTVLDLGKDTFLIQEIND